MFDLSNNSNVIRCTTTKYLKKTHIYFSIEFFLAHGGESCTETCEDKGLECNLDKLKYLASNDRICKQKVEDLTGLEGYTTMEEGGKRDDDNSGCTYHPDQNGWAQIMDKSGLAEPTCTEISGDPKRQRVCACQGTKF